MEAGMDNIQESLGRFAREIPGFLGASLVDHTSGMALGTLGNSIDVDLASAGNTEVVRAKLRVMQELGIKGNIVDILITLEEQQHLIRPVGDRLFLYLAIERLRGNLGMARLIMTEVGDALRL